jgi:RimJ/RimL family protein N-acetyltransferase
MRVEPQVLENDYVRLEPMGEHHRELLRGPASDPELWEWTTIRGDGEYFDAWFDQLLTATMDGLAISHVVYRKSDESIVGHSAYLTISPTNERLEIGWTWYVADARASKVNPSCKRLLLGNAFDNGAGRVELRTHGKNLRSQAAMKKMGAKCEGTYRRHMKTWKGDFRDTVYFSILKDEWAGVRDGLDARLTGE